MEGALGVTLAEDVWMAMMFVATSATPSTACTEATVIFVEDAIGATNGVGLWDGPVKLILAVDAFVAAMRELAASARRVTGMMNTR